MEIYSSEQEQIDAIKKWWDDNGRAVIVGVIIGLGALFGWQTWQTHDQQMTGEASFLYTKMMTDLQAGRYVKINEFADEIIKKYPSTPYPELSALAAAKAAVELDKIDEAKTRLQWAVDNAGMEDSRHVARIRLVQLYILDNETDLAESVLKSKFPEAYGARVNELKGDLYVAKGDLDAAKLSYDNALNGELDTEKRQLVQLKRDRLGNLTPEEPEPTA